MSMALRDGRITMRGRYEELIARGGHYATLHALQFGHEGTGTR